MTDRPRFTGGKELEERAKLSRFAVLISNKGTGSNLQALIAASEQGVLPHGSVRLVISDQEDSLGIVKAQEHGIDVHVRVRQGKIDSPERDIYSQELAEFLNINGITIAVMAGFGTIVSPSFHKTFEGVSINVHPGDIPDDLNNPNQYDDGTIIPWNCGMMTEKAVANFLGRPYAVCTVHIATTEKDFGPVLARGFARTLKEDDVDSLYGRLKLQEHRALVESLKDVRRIYEVAGKELPLF